MDKTSRKKRDILQKFHEKPTKIPKKFSEEVATLKSSVLTEKPESPFSSPPEPQKLKQTIKELQAKNVALNTNLAEAQVTISNLQVEIARMEKKLHDISKERGKLEESQYLSNKAAGELAKEKMRSKDLTEKIEELQLHIERQNDSNERKLRKILSFINKAREMSSIVSSLKGRFFEKADLVGSWKETFRKIEQVIKSDCEVNEDGIDNGQSVEEVRNEFMRIFKEFEEENGFLREKLEEFQNKMKESKEVLEKHRGNFERMNEKFEETKGEILEFREENDALKRQIEALERKSENQTEIIDILKLRIKGFEEEINEEEEAVDSVEDLPRISEPEEENVENPGIEQEIEDLDQEIKYIQGILNKKI